MAAVSESQLAMAHVIHVPFLCSAAVLWILQKEINPPTP